MNFKVFNIGNMYVHNAYILFKENAEDVVSDERASFIIKAIMSGVIFNIFVYDNKVIKGIDVVSAIVKCKRNQLMFQGKMFEEINGKYFKDLMVEYQGFIDEGRVNVIEICKYQSKEDIEYFIQNI